jgi:hypothetical protein
MTSLILKRGKFSRPSGQWQDEDYDVLADGKPVGRIYEDAHLSTPSDMRWFWSITEIVPARSGVTNGTAADARGGDGEVSGGVGESQAGTSGLLKGLLFHASNRGRHRKARHQLESACALAF